MCAECLFVNPVADIAVLGCPDEQDPNYNPDAYHELTDEAPVLRVGKARSGPGWVLSLQGRWVRTTIDLHRSIHGILLSVDPTFAGQSGSPILSRAGCAVGVIAIGTETVDTKTSSGQRVGPQPILTRELPGWLLSA